MGKIILQTVIRAPIERCFDLSRSIDLHVKSAEATSEKAIDGITSGLISLGETVTWEAKHFGFKQRLKVQITEFQRPFHFRDSQFSGIFKKFDHDHYFESSGDFTIIKEVFDFTCPFGILGRIGDYFVYQHLKKFLIKRNQVIKEVAESQEWKNFL